MCSPFRILRVIIPVALVLVVYARLTAHASQAATAVPVTPHVPVPAAPPQAASMPLGAIVAAAIFTVLLLAALYARHRSRRAAPAPLLPVRTAPIPAVTYRPGPGDMPLDCLDREEIARAVAGAGKTGGV